MSTPSESPHHPTVTDLPEASLQVTEDIPIGHRIIKIIAYDQDDDKLWYDIIGRLNKM